MIAFALPYHLELFKKVKHLVIVDVAISEIYATIMAIFESFPLKFQDLTAKEILMVLSVCEILCSNFSVIY